MLCLFHCQIHHKIWILMMKKEKKSTSKRMKLSLSPSVPHATGHRKFNKGEAKRRALMLGTPTKDGWRTITTKKDEGMKVSEENRVKIVEWVKKAHLCVVVLTNQAGHNLVS